MKMTENMMESVNSELLKYHKEGELSDDELDSVCGGRNITINEGQMLMYWEGYKRGLELEHLDDCANLLEKALGKYYDHILSLADDAEEELFDLDKWLKEV